MMLDTNAISALARSDPALFRLLEGTTHVSVPFVALAEFRYGVARSRHRRVLERWLQALEQMNPVLYANRETLDHYARVRLELQRAGTPIPANDVWIAALCRQHDLAIVSLDAHFDRVADVRRVTW